MSVMIMFSKLTDDWSTCNKAITNRPTRTGIFIWILLITQKFTLLRFSGLIIRSTYKKEDNKGNKSNVFSMHYLKRLILIYYNLLIKSFVMFISEFMTRLYKITYPQKAKLRLKACLEKVMHMYTPKGMVNLICGCIDKTRRGRPRW